MKSSVFIPIPRAVMLIVLMSPKWNGAVFSSDVLPCDFQDSINITDGTRDPNDNTIEFNNLLFHKNQYAELNYDIDKKTKSRKATAPYFRGCPCSIKPCIRLCCPFGKAVLNASRCENYEDAEDLIHEVLDSDHKSKLVHLNEEFSFVYPYLEGNRYQTDEYTLTHVMFGFHQFYNYAKISFAKYILEWNNSAQ